MQQPPVNPHFLRQPPLLSALLLMLANMMFGFFLHEYNHSYFVWGTAIAYITLECGVLSIAWRPARDLFVMGFKSDIGYAMMALAGASFAVVLVVWVKVSSYFLVMLAAALLLRVKLYTGRGGDVISFLILLGTSLIGLAISWIPRLAQAGRLPFFGS
ncbi:MAG: hypothetical protein WBA76_21075 [Phormidesmis sp.]